MEKAEINDDYDPILESLNVYMDILNIFIRILAILSEEENKKKNGEENQNNQDDKESKREYNRERKH